MLAIDCTLVPAAAGFVLLYVVCVIVLLPAAAVDILLHAGVGVVVLLFAAVIAGVIHPPPVILLPSIGVHGCPAGLFHHGGLLCIARPTPWW